MQVEYYGQTLTVETFEKEGRAIFIVHFPHKTIELEKQKDNSWESTARKRSRSITDLGNIIAGREK